MYFVGVLIVHIFVFFTPNNLQSLFMWYCRWLCDELVFLLLLFSFANEMNRKIRNYSFEFLAFCLHFTISICRIFFYLYLYLKWENKWIAKKCIGKHQHTHVCNRKLLSMMAIGGCSNLFCLKTRMRTSEHTQCLK